MAAILSAFVLLANPDSCLLHTTIYVFRQHFWDMHILVIKCPAD
jgi:hypothetical protein